MDRFLFPSDIFVYDTAWVARKKDEKASKILEAEDAIRHKNESIRTLMNNIPPIGVNPKTKTNHTHQDEVDEQEQDSDSDASTQEADFAASLSSGSV